MSTNLEEIKAAYIAAKQRAFHSGTRAIATPEQRQAWGQEFRDTIAKTKAEAQVEVLREVADPFQNVTGSDTPTERAGVRKLTCEERDAVLHEGGRYEGWEVESSLTDAYGEYGAPIIMTTWGKGDKFVIDVRHPHHGNYSPPDRKPCEHYTWKREDDD